jgi:tetratricopeptide (TPR) repeat protein
MIKLISILLLFIANNLNAQTKESADSLFMKEQWAAAKPLYTQYLNEHPTDALSWNRLGYCYQQTNQYKQAIDA